MDGFGTVYKLDILRFYPYRNEITELLQIAIPTYKTIESIKDPGYVKEDVAY